MIAMDFGVGALETEFWRLLFVMTRIGAAMLAAPLFGHAAVPPQARVIMAGGVSVLVCAWLPPAVPPALFSLAGLVTILSEILVGLALGFVLQIAFAAPIMAAELIGGGMGMSMAVAVDPASGAQSPALGQYFTIVLVLVFLGLGAHLRWIGLVIESYRAFPPGEAWLGTDRIAAVAGFAGEMFTAAAAMALPVTLILLLAQLTTGVISRSAPALNLFALGLPAGILAGIAALIAAAPLLADQMTDLAEIALGQAAQAIAR